MNPSSAEAPGGGITPMDIIRILFKWKIFVITFTVLGLIGGVVVWFTQKPLYVSTAKIFVLYIAQAKNVTGVANDDRIVNPDSRGDNILNNEVELLRTLDSCYEVVDIVGVDKLAGKKDSGASRESMALLVQRNLEPEVSKTSNVLKVSFNHQDPDVARSTLEFLVEKYKEKHLIVHRKRASSDDFLKNNAEQLRQSLMNTDKEIRELLNKAKIINMEDSKRAAAAQVSKLRQDILTAEAELAELRSLTTASVRAPEVKATNEVKEAGIPQDKLTEYRGLFFRHEQLRNQKLDLLTKFTAENPIVIRTAAQFAEVEKLKQQMETEFPRLVGTVSLNPETRGGGPGAPSAAGNPLTDATRIIGLEAKVSVLKQQADMIRQEATGFEQEEVQLFQLQRRKILEEANYRAFAAALEQARIDEQLGKDRSSNINVVQKPSTPVLLSKAKYKAAGTPVGVGIGLGLLIPLLFELLLRQRVTGSRELEGKFNLPVFLNIPMAGGSLKRRKNKRGPSPKSDAAPVAINTEIAPWTEEHPLRPYFEALRDRTVMFFDKIAHKPKLIGVAGCHAGSGTTSVAAGLAATLSETGDGNVLLVDMNIQHGAAHPFLHGKPMSLPNVIEDGEGKTAAKVQENLFMATGSESSENLTRILPKRFSGLVPKLKASDYDYIIFDLPPISQTSVTPRIAGMMDLVILIIEAEKVPRNLLRESVKLFRDSHARLVTVVNKSRQYLPSWIHQE